jgi:hypothetical protein
MTIYQNTLAGSGFLQGATGATGPAANTTITTYQFVAISGQSTFSGADSNSNSLTYTVNGIVVTLNGVVLKNTNEYIATNGTSITLVSAASAGDELNIYTFPAYNIANALTPAQANTIYLGLNGGTISGNVNFANGSNFSVPVGNTAQRPAASPGYIRYNTDLNTLESANNTAWANVGSGSASSGGGGGITWAPLVQNTNFIAVKNTGYLVNTYTGNVTVTLPASPSFGDTLNFVDYGSAFSANALIVYPNGKNISGNTSNITFTINGQATSLVYTDANKGWLNYSSGSAVGAYLIEYLLVAGGGGGASGYSAGGGGAGGMLTGTISITNGIPYTVTVGGGGAGITGGSGTWLSSDAGSHGTNGGNSSIGSLLIAVGGGGGAGFGGSGGGGVGRSGGSGGAGSYKNSAGSGTSGQGNAGGTGSNAANHLGAGGGGAGATGGNAPDSGNSAGAGGTGVSSSISGSPTYYAGGGGGGIYDNGGQQNASGGSGGNGGGGAGATNSRTNGSSGTGNLGGGGGGAGAYEPQAWYTGGSGGSGIVIIRYLGIQRATGGTVTYNGTYTTHTFTSSGTFVS